jgi:hypothetical protein
LLLALVKPALDQTLIGKPETLTQMMAYLVVSFKLKPIRHALQCAPNGRFEAFYKAIIDYTRSGTISGGADIARVMEANGLKGIDRQSARFLFEIIGQNHGGRPLLHIEAILRSSGL